MCGPEVLFNFIVLDISYVLLVVGAGVVFRAKGSGPFTWVSFGSLAVMVGGFLFWATYHFQTAAAATGTDAAMSALSGAC